MKTVGRGVLFAVLLVSASGSIAAAHGELMRGEDISGNFALVAPDEPALNGTFAMSEVGDTVSGSIQTAEGRTVVSGTLLQGNPFHFSARWRGPAGETGWMSMNVNGNGTVVAGRYGDDQSHHGGQVSGTLAEPQYARPELP